MITNQTAVMDREEMTDEHCDSDGFSLLIQVEITAVIYGRLFV